MLSEGAVKEINELTGKYANKRSAVMPALFVVQREYGYVNEEGMREIANILGLRPVQVFEVATFYTMYNKKPVGKYHIQVCTNISCSLLGADHIMDFLSQRLGIKVKETTPDKRFTLSAVECLGSCGTAPMMQINDRYHEDLTKEKIEEILKGLK
ncbi:MAG: NADH-quinone oxidoreductase subunit NuoE [Nitrospirae bacterium]|nr:NADH-quinone oxidoreductase subunit NuoE [Nitrospirota bacterium]